MPRTESVDPRVAFVIDALPSYRGAERVLGAALEIYPTAPVYTLIHRPAEFAGTVIEVHRVHTSWIQHVPGGRVHYRGLLPLLPATIEHFDLRQYDIVISLSYAVAHGVRTCPGQLHIGYTFAPLRYAWQDAGEYFQRGPLAPLAQRILRAFRKWDRAAAGRVDHLVAISEWTAACVLRAYGRVAGVIYPPVDLRRFQPLAPRGNYYVVVSRLVGHKRLEIMVEAFSRLGLPLIVVGDGPERRRLAALAAPNVRLIGHQDDQSTAEIVGRAKALVHAASEDFGLVLAEAQAAGCPVIAYAGGAAPEIILDGRTGFLFHQPTVAALMEAVLRFEAAPNAFSPAEVIQNVQRFGKERFQDQFNMMVQREWTGFLRKREDAPVPATSMGVPSQVRAPQPQVSQARAEAVTHVRSAADDHGVRST